MRRRDFLAGATSLVVTPALSQQPSPTKRLAICSPSETESAMIETSENRYYRVLFAELRRLGQIEGQNLTIDRYGREKNSGGLQKLVAEIISSNPDVVYSIPPGIFEFKRQKAKFALVALTGDPVATGLVESLARPGGNLTGVSVDTGPTIHAKRLGVLKDIFPATSKIACVAFRYQWESFQGPAVRAACDAAGVALVPALLEFPTVESSYREAVAQAVRDGADTIMIADSPDALHKHALIVKLVGESRLPAVYALPEFVSAGGLVGYSFDLVELNKRAANSIDAILRGKNPGEIPYYQASRFHLSVNTKAAQALGLTVPLHILASADEVID